ncbi:olfactory receptor 5G9-like [Anomaloglossus baeobatrachus]|uniref:olfactory receptor 5G9-like n=1 Tax=Anomaloglossus baeobatrachus TaxID=238106 RepID=UPI003F4FEDCF
MSVGNLTRIDDGLNAELYLSIPQDELLCTLNPSRKISYSAMHCKIDKGTSRTHHTNLTDAIQFVLLGFQVSLQLRVSLFCLLLVVFWFTICGHLLIITLVSTCKNLHTPMYFFISQLSIKLFECLLLTVMSYDRYVAICNPLRYTTIMTSGYYLRLVVTSWLASFSMTIIYTLTASRLKFCGPNIIDHFFCDLLPLQDISCSDPFPINLLMRLVSIPFVIIPSMIIVLSYGNIARAVLKIQSDISRQKAFSTCSSHLTVVSIFYLTLFSVYIFPTKGQPDINKISSILYTVFTPLVNPIIYSFRNKDIIKAAQQTVLKYL